MSALTQASRELFARREDERFASLEALKTYCQERKQRSADHWSLPQKLVADPRCDRLGLIVGDDGAFEMNDWSFSQVCRLAGVGKDTINRLSPDTAARAFRETLPVGDKPLQVLTSGETVRSVHGVSYTRLWDEDLLSIVHDYATGFEPPPVGMNGGTGLYAGEQDMFVFLIDPTGWTEIEGEAFAPGFFLWNSEVGRRSVGLSTFWFQAVCQNHIVWEPTDVREFTRKHTARVHQSLTSIRQMIEGLVAKRDGRRDAFVSTIKKAMETTLGDNAEQVEKVLSRSGITRTLAKKAIASAQKSGRFSIFSIVDALTQLTQNLPNGGDRYEADEKAGALLALAA